MEVAHTAVASTTAAVEAVEGAKNGHRSSRSLAEEDENNHCFGWTPNVHHRDHAVAPTRLDEYLREQA